MWCGESSDSSEREMGWERGGSWTKQGHSTSDCISRNIGKPLKSLSQRVTVQIHSSRSSLCGVMETRLEEVGEGVQGRPMRRFSQESRYSGH